METISSWPVKVPTQGWGRKRLQQLSVRFSRKVSTSWRLRLQARPRSGAEPQWMDLSWKESPRSWLCLSVLGAETALDGDECPPQSGGQTWLPGNEERWSLEFQSCESTWAGGLAKGPVSSSGQAYPLRPWGPSNCPRSLLLSYLLS